MLQWGSCTVKSTLKAPWRVYALPSKRNEESIIITNCGSCGVSVSSWLVGGGWLYLELLGRSSSFFVVFCWEKIYVHSFNINTRLLVSYTRGPSCQWAALELFTDRQTDRQTHTQNCLLQSSLGSSPGWRKKTQLYQLNGTSNEISYNTTYCSCGVRLVDWSSKVT